MKHKVLVYTANRSPRLDYVLNHIFVHHLSWELSICEDLEQFQQSKSHIKVSYGLAIAACVSVPKSDFLYFTDCRPIQPKAVPDDTYSIVLFPFGECFSLPFDLFSATFYLLSRYEEYQDYAADEHGRFPAKASIAHQNNFLNKPIIDIWIKTFAKQLLTAYKLTITSEPASLKIKPSFDIDQAYAYAHRPIYQNLLGLINDFRKLKFQTIRARLSILWGSRKDPFDSFDTIISELEKHDLSNDSIFFILNNYGGPYDKGHDITQSTYHQALSKISKKIAIGIHPSYTAYLDQDRTEQEIKSLSQVLQIDIRKSRFHYIRLKLPESYQLLLKCGISEDYSMGYPDAIGFRAGTSRPFYWYNLNANQITRLLVHPFCLMDVTLKNYLNLTTPEALSVVSELKTELKHVDGVLSFIWHNSSMDQNSDWQNWSSVLQKILAKC